MPRNFDLSAWDKKFASKETFPDLTGESLSSLVDEIHSWSLDQKQLPADLVLRIEPRINKIYCDMKRNTCDFAHDQVAQHRVELLTYIKYEITKHRRGRFPMPKIASVFERLEALGHERIGVPDWFIPPYELRTRVRSSKTSVLRIDPTKSSRSNLRVWVKHAQTGEFSTQDQFVRDMTRWYQLKHPHVEHLLDACHVGERFFPSRECGDFEDLSTALMNPHDGWHKLTKKPALHRVIWQMLYKAALGLNSPTIEVLPMETWTETSWFQTATSSSCEASSVDVNKSEAKLRLRMAPERMQRCRSLQTMFMVSVGVSLKQSAGRGIWSSIMKFVLESSSIAEMGMRSQLSTQGILKYAAELSQVAQIFASEEEYGSLDPSVMAKHEESLITSLSSDLAVRKLLEVIRVALESTDALFSAVWPTNKQVFGRLTDTRTQLLIKNMNSELRTKLWTSYRPILESFHSAVTTHAKEHSGIVRLASSRQASEGNYQVNLDLDRLCKLGSLSLARRDHDWQIRWNQNSASFIELLSTKVREEAQTARGANDHNKTRVVGFAFLRFEYNQRRSRYTPDELSALESIIQTIHQDCGSVETTDSPWFIPPCGRGGEEAQSQRRDAQSSRVFQRSEHLVSAQPPEHRRAFRRVPRPAGFLCVRARNERAAGYTLEIKVNGLYRHRSDTRHRLCDAANGLRYLHERGIMHGDLKCDNILIGSDGLAKLADFGLSSFKLDFGEAKTTGAERWMAPEILNDKKSSSFASDIYSFGMCVIEAVSGAIPWTQFQPLVSVKRDIKKGILPVRPERFRDDNQLRQTDEAWKLVPQMCCFDQEKRLRQQR